MTAHYLDSYRSKIAAYTWRYKDIPEKLINEELMAMHCKPDEASSAIDNTIIRIMVRSIENRIIDYDDLTRAGYSVVIGFYNQHLQQEVYSSTVFH